MEQLRIDRKALGLRAKSRDKLRGSQDLAPLQYDSGDGGPDIDEDLFARIDELLGEDVRDDEVVA